jgi:prepilin-type N-terminal cleavage/methylation domain-containing protein
VFSISRPWSSQDKNPPCTTGKKTIAASIATTTAHPILLFLFCTEYFLSQRRQFLQFYYLSIRPARTMLQFEGNSDRRLRIMKNAFTLIEILIVVAIIALLAAVGIPSFVGSRKAAEQEMRKVNVSSVNAAKDQWSILYNKTVGESVNWDDIKSYIGGGNDDQIDLKVGGEVITINNIGTSASYPSWPE